MSNQHRRKRAKGGILIEEGLLLSIISVGAIAGLAMLGGGLNDFSTNNTQAQMANNGGGVPGQTMPEQGQLYDATGPTGQAAQVAGSYNGAMNDGDGIYSMTNDDYIAGAYTFGGVGLVEEEVDTADGGGEGDGHTAEEGEVVDISFGTNSTQSSNTSINFPTSSSDLNLSKPIIPGGTTIPVDGFPTTGNNFNLNNAFLNNTTGSTSSTPAETTGSPSNTTKPSSGGGGGPYVSMQDNQPTMTSGGNGHQTTSDLNPGNSAILGRGGSSVNPNDFTMGGGGYSNVSLTNPNSGGNSLGGGF